MASLLNDFGLFRLLPFWVATLMLSVDAPNCQAAISTNAFGPSDLALRFDSTSLIEALDATSGYNLALETTNLNWISSPVAPAIRSEDLGYSESLPGYGGFFDGVSFENGATWIETTMTGPGIVICKGFVKPNYGGQWIVQLSVDGQVREETTYNNGYGQYIDGPFDLQASLGAGQHVVRYSVQPTNEGGASPVILHSVAMVSVDPASELAAVLAEIYPDRQWTIGGTQPPMPLYRLVEGALSLRGIAFPALAPGETSWIETNVTGAAVAQFVWDSARQTECRVNGRKACRSSFEQYFKSYSSNQWTTLDLPVGSHLLRWEGGSATAELRDFTLTEGSAVADYLARVNPPIIWATQSYSDSIFQKWGVVPDGPLAQWTDGGQTMVPGTGLPVLGAGDQTFASVWIPGPAVVTYDVRQSSQWVSNSFTESPIGPPDLNWHPWGKVITEDSYVEFNIEEDDATSEPEIFLRNLRIISGSAYPAWSTAHSNAGVPLADDDQDGLDNLLEFAFGTHPKYDNPPVELTLTSTPSGRQLQLPTLPYDATGLTYEVQTSPNLQTWTSHAIVPANAAHQAGPVVSLALPAAAKEFIRVKVHF